MSLLIRGFGVQVPGGAPGLTWPFSLKAKRLLSLWGTDGAFLGHARAPRLLTTRPRDQPGNLAWQLVRK
jgi:hypothetical protein